MIRAEKGKPSSGSRIIDWLKWGEERLSCLPEASARESRDLLGEILEDPLAPWTRDREVLPDELSACYASWVERRRQREPFHLITGSVPFLEERFAVAPGTLIPRPETESLVENVLRILDSRSPERILDLGCGSGILGISLLKKFPKAHCLAVDRSVVPLEVSRKNALALGVLSRIHFVQGDWTEMLRLDQGFDLIVSNPPYIASGDLSGLDPEILFYEPREALDGGPDGLVFYRRLMAVLPGLLSTGGVAAVEIGSCQGDFFRSDAGFVSGCGAPLVFPDILGLDRIVLWKKG
ncbi:MAG: peptide chain release factor N(5)-glutamine methyltransferase [Nitrospirae bacterium]|jgi:release factor glutamine methyltransferase|uniref:peptide chain release factor N(5)-glutamine methyltransferase n=1 Tax=Leptospirillum ferriphilum TaxID=178606 RepID=UPI0000F0CE2B|nr:peptide chain release factor N(5)-glutamine methyltransferase [Leptospirillum ferriphilum]EAY56719.1 MAG: Modification methylase (HemK) [Leptospirillum rubarum]MCL5259669.1 peptide chain release factor N(5)-glutamine methyltransferase [Nitrospirota bacterium]